MITFTPDHIGIFNSPFLIQIDLKNKKYNIIDKNTKEIKDSFDLDISEVYKSLKTN